MLFLDSRPKMNVLDYMLANLVNGGNLFSESLKRMALLHIVGSALSAGFSGPYEVLKKLSDTDCMFVCHVNILKVYHNRERARTDVLDVDEDAVSMSSTVAIACSIVNLTDVTDIEDDRVMANDTPQQCARLTNSEILSDLTSHQSHLSE